MTQGRTEGRHGADCRGGQRTDVQLPNLFSTFPCQYFCGTGTRSFRLCTLILLRAALNRCPLRVSYRHPEQEWRRILPNRKTMRHPMGAPIEHHKGATCPEEGRTCRRGRTSTPFRSQGRWEGHRHSLSAFPAKFNPSCLRYLFVLFATSQRR